MKATPEDLMTDPTMIQNEVCYLTNVNLQCDHVANNEHEIDIQHLREPNKKDIGLKPFSLVSNVSRSTRKSQVPHEFIDTIIYNFFYSENQQFNES